MTEDETGQNQEEREDGILMESFRVSGFRGIRDLMLPALRPLNFITGAAGTGKTCVLDALEVYATRGNPSVLREILRRNDELLADRETGETQENQRALFHQGAEERGFSLEGHDPRRHIDVRLEPEEEESGNLTITAGTSRMKVNLENKIDWRFTGFRKQEGHFEQIPCRRLGPEPARNAQIAELWDQAVMTSRTDDIMKTVAESTGIPVERMACVGNGAQRRAIVSIRGQKEPVPLRRLGQAAVQAVALMLAFQAIRGGMLLLDQPETGLNPHAVRVLWRWFTAHAEAQRVQVFAATSSLDAIGAAVLAAQDLGQETIGLTRLAPSGAGEPRRYGQEDVREAVRVGWDFTA